MLPPADVVYEALKCRAILTSGMVAQAPLQTNGKDTVMGSLSVWHWLIALAIGLLLFGRGKIPELMGDLAKGIRTFRNGMAEADDEAAPQPVLLRIKDDRR